MLTQPNILQVSWYYFLAQQQELLFAAFYFSKCIELKPPTLGAPTSRSWQSQLAVELIELIS